MTTRYIELVRKKKFVAATLDPKYETFIVYVVFLIFTLLDIGIHLFCKLQIAGLIAKKSFIKISTKYTDFADILFPNLISELPKHTRINNYTIKIVDG